jgi:hypothetical protein
MATLRLVRFADGGLGLQGDMDPSRYADFSVYDLDGEGGEPFDYGHTTWDIVEGIRPARYDAGDDDSFRAAREKIIGAARKAGIELPDCED